MQKRDKTAKKQFRRAIGATATLFVPMLFAVSCAQHRLPSDVPSYLQSRAEQLGSADEPTEVLRWHGKRKDLHTYWGIKTVQIKAKTLFPENWQEAGDAAWNVDARTKGGTPLPFIGVVRNYENLNKTELSKLVPPLELPKIPDGLYVAIKPNVKNADQEIRTVEPVAYLCEIRDHSFQPFRVKIPLLPEGKESRTPPETAPDVKGTAFPYD